MLDARWGVNGIFAFYLMEAIPILFVIPLLPRYFTDPSNEEAKSEGTIECGGGASVPLILPRLCLAAVFSFYIMVGAYWAFIERAGSAANINPEAFAQLKQALSQRHVSREVMQSLGVTDYGAKAFSR